jgi:hypothetical protein
MKVAFASIAAFAFAFALFVGTSLAQEIVAASYTDGTCTTIKTNPQTLQSGQCVYSSDFNFWYTIKAGPNNTAKYSPLPHSCSPNMPVATVTKLTSMYLLHPFSYFYNCTKGCAESSCALKGSSTFGSCPSITMGNGQIVHVDAFRVETKETIDVRVFSDAQCGQQLDDVGTIALASGQCQYMKSFGWSLMVSHVNPNDAPPSRQLAYRANCNSDCTKCTKYGRMELNKCTLVGTSQALVLRLFEEHMNLTLECVNRRVRVGQCEPGHVCWDRQWRHAGEVGAGLDHRRISCRRRSVRLPRVGLPLLHVESDQKAPRLQPHQPLMRLPAANRCLVFPLNTGHKCIQ